MLLIKNIINNSIPIFVPSTPLTKIIDFMAGNKYCLDNIRIKTGVASNDCLNQHINDCVFIVCNSRLVSVFTAIDLVNAFASKLNIAEVSIAEVMKAPIEVASDIDTVSALAIMRQHQIRYLPIIGDEGKFLGVITAEIIAEKLENRVEAGSSELENTNKLQQKILELQRVEQRYARTICMEEIGIWEWNIKTNHIFIDQNFKNILGYEEDDFSGYLGNNFEDWLKYIHLNDINAVRGELNAYIEGLIPKYEIEYRMLHKDGKYVWFLGRGAMIRDEFGKPYLIAGSNTDITVRKHTESHLKASLKEKELLLKEIHHRVKNNLQILSSLLRLQASYIKDKQVLEIFRDSQNRVRAMAMIHESLYHSSDLGKINFSDYIRNLISNLTHSYGVNKDINIQLNIDEVLLRIDTAIPCALIINELVSNAIKHAFVETALGDIYVDFTDLGQGKYSLIVGDNGIGIIDDIEVRRNQSLGLQLVWNLVEQLEGTIAFNTRLGTLFTVRFVEHN